MLERLIDIAVHRRVLTLVATAGFVVFGIFTFGKLKIEAFPDVTNVQVMVIGLYPGQAAEEVEKQVTIPIERALTGVPQVLVQRSITSFGLSQVILTFEDNVDIYFARQQVSERLPDAELPDGVEAHLGPNDTPVGQVYQYTLESDHHTPSELRSWQDWVVSKHLMRTAGVADVVSFGGFQKEYHVLADPAQLRNNGLTLRDVIQAVSVSNGATSGGYLQNGESEFVVRGRGYLRNMKDIENTVVRATNGTPVLVRYGRQGRRVLHAAPGRRRARRGDRLHRGDGAAAPRREPQGRADRACTRASIASTRTCCRPACASCRSTTARGWSTPRSRPSRTTCSRGRSWSAWCCGCSCARVSGSIAVAVTMPLALLTAFVGLYYAGVPANLLSMGAIDFGILLDGAVILVENAYRHLAEEQPPPEEVPHVIARASKEVLRPTLFSMSIIAAAMMPIFTLERVEGRIFRPVALTYAFSLAGRAVLHHDLACRR